MSLRKPTYTQRLRHSLVGQWRGVEDGPLVDVPTKAIGDVLSNLMKELGMNERLRLEDVLAAWRSVAGEFIGKNSQPDGYSRGVLTVRLLQPSMHHALTLERPALIRKLNEYLGVGVVRDIRFRHG